MNEVKKPDIQNMIDCQRICLKESDYNDALADIEMMSCHELDSNVNLAMRQESMREGYKICDEEWEAYHDQELAKKDKLIEELEYELLEARYKAMGDDL